MSEEEIGEIHVSTDKPSAGITRIRRKRGADLFRTFHIRQFDFLLVILVVILNGIGIAAIGSAEPGLRNRQIYGMVFSLVLMAAISTFDYRKLLKLRWVFYGISLAMLLAVQLMGSTGGGAQRWVEIAGVRFQPSEMTKLFLILFYAYLIGKYHEKITTFPVIVMCILLVIPQIFLVFEQPDLSTSVMIFIIFCAMMFSGGISWKLVGAVVGISVPAAIALFNMVLQPDQKLVDPYQRLRILSWLHPEEYPDLAYQTLNSVMAIGSGQLLGKGYNTNEISSLLNSGYISESQTDFIFTVIGEEFGFAGSFIVVLLILLIAAECYRTALRIDAVQGKILAVGMGTWIGFQGFVNIGVVTGVLPNTGLPLPFVSYGLTSLVSLYAGIGFVLNVHMQIRKR